MPVRDSLLVFVLVLAMLVALVVILASTGVVSVSTHDPSPTVELTITVPKE